MTMNEYQKIAGETAIYPGQGSVDGLVYTALGLGEAGEVQNKVKKVIRDHGRVLTEEMRIAIAKELGGNLWYISQCATEIGMDLEMIAKMNLEELLSRQQRGVLMGSGDNR